VPFVAVRDGQPIYVRVIGRGEPVVLLHGLGMKSSHWLPFILPFLHRFRFYMPNFRGAGHSLPVRLNQPDVFQNHMEDVEDIVRHFGLRDFQLVGYSLGASTALHWQRAGGFAGVRRYLHIDQSPCVGNRADWSHGLFGQRQGELFEALRRLEALLNEHAHVEEIHQLPQAVRVRVALLLADTFSRILGRRHAAKMLQVSSRSSWLLSRLMPITRLADIRAYLQSYLAGGHDYRQSLPACETPVTVMIGMRSPLYHPAGQMAIADYARDCRVVRLERSGHVPLMDEPLRFTRELGRFLYRRYDRSGANTDI
jgi:pimeloyl-ACP methyl ester carboxylesterase